jgi:signal transduction histidine kinase
LAVACLRIAREPGDRPATGLSGGLAAGLAAWLVVTVAAAVTPVWFFALAWVAVVLVGVLASRARGRADLALVAAVAAVAVLAPLPMGTADVGLVLTLAMATAMSTAIGIGLLVRSQRAQTSALRRAVVTEERTSMARDLHDLVAHEVTGIVVLAQAAGGVTTDARARTAFERIEASGHEALGQIRAMVQALRDASDDAGAGPALAPTGHGTAALRELVADFAASAPADVAVDIAEVELDPASDSAVQRLVAEALTNVRRHAAGAESVEVHVRPDVQGRALVVRVANDGAGSGGLGQGSGYGLVGVRERLALVGGELVAGPVEPGSWVTEARIPLPPKGTDTATASSAAAGTSEEAP